VAFSASLFEALHSCCYYLKIVPKEDAVMAVKLAFSLNLFMAN